MCRIPAAKGLPREPSAARYFCLSMTAAPSLCVGWQSRRPSGISGELLEKNICEERLARAMKEAGGLLIQISTDYVFGKEPYNVPCREEQQGTPTGVYGQTKLHGEQKIGAVGCKHVIIRTAWLYSEFGKNFCKTMMQLTATRPELKVVFDQTGTPTYALDLAEASCGCWRTTPRRPRPSATPRRASTTTPTRGFARGTTSRR